jgi:WD40 repeat protein
MFFSALFLTLPFVGQVSATDRHGDSLPPGAILRMGSVRMRHAERIQSVAFAPDGAFLASADSSYIVRLWDVRSGQLRLELPKGAGSLVVFSPDGKTLATGGYYQKLITLWNAANGERLLELPQNARSLAFSADGKQLVAAGQDAIVRLWDVGTGDVIRSFKGHTGALFAVALSPDGKRIASGGGGDGTAPQSTEVRLWDAGSGAELRRFEGHTGWIYSLAFSPHENVLASASPYEGKLWDLTTGKERHRLNKATYVVAFSPTANQLATAWQLAVHDPVSGQKLVDCKDDKPQSYCLAWSPDGGVLATGDDQGQVRLWDTTTGDEIVRDKGHVKGVRSVAFSLDGSVAASVSGEDQTLRVWGLASGAQLRKFEFNTDAESTWYKHAGAIFFAPDGRTIGTYTSDGMARFWDLAGLKSREMKVSANRVSTMAMSRDGNLLAVVGSTPSYATEIRLIEIDEGKERARLTPFGKTGNHDSRISTIAFSPNGTLMAVGLTRGERAKRPGEAETSTNDSVQLWDIPSAKLLRSFRRDDLAPGAVGFSPDGRWLAVAATGKQPLQLWNVVSGDEPRRFAPKDTGRSWYDSSPFAFAPDSATIAAATIDRDIVLYELATGKEMQRLKGHVKAVTSLAFSPDGRTLLSGSEDATVLLWDISRPPPAKASDAGNQKALEKSWQDLADANSAVAHLALRRLIVAPDRALALLREQLRPSPERNLADLPKLIAALDDANEEASMATLKQFGIQAAPALYEALRNKPTAPVRRRIELVLEAIGEYPVPPDDLRRGRAIQLLEQIASPEAEQILSSLARGNDAAALAALSRLEARRRTMPVRLK